MGGYSVKDEIKRELKYKKMKRENPELLEGKMMDNISIATADTMIEPTPGPGAYNPVEYDDFQFKKKTTVPKSKRFKESRTDTKAPLKINYDLIEYLKLSLTPIVRELQEFPKFQKKSKKTKS